MYARVVVRGNLVDTIMKGRRRKDKDLSSEGSLSAKCKTITPQVFSAGMKQKYETVFNCQQFSYKLVFKQDS